MDYISYIVIFYSVFLLVFLIFSVAGIYHLWRFGYAGDLSKSMIAVYSIIVIGIIISSIFLISINMGIR
jgi:hypothetical protein